MTQRQIDQRRDMKIVQASSLTEAENRKKKQPVKAGFIIPKHISAMYGWVGDS